MHFPTLTLTITLALTLSVSALRPSPTPVSNRDRHRDLSKRVHSPADGLTQFNAFHAVSGRDVSAREVGEGGEGGWEKEKRLVSVTGDDDKEEEMWMKREEREMTNGERMKRGLPPKKPLFRRQASGAAAPRPRPSALPPSSRTANAGSGGSGTCTPRTGVIRVSGGGFNGYLSRRANPFGEYLVQTERGNALSVVLVDECNTAPGGSENLRAVNGFATFPLLGGIQGFSSENPDLRPHTRNYLYVGGVAQSAVGARPAVVGNSFSATTGDSEPSESAIWVVGSDGQVTVRWVNADGSTPANSVVYVGGRNVLAVVGDVEAFVGSVEAASPVTLTFVV